MDIDLILAPISQERPAGENLRYTVVYDEIQEARRADDQLDRGDWQHDIKTSDWQRVITLCTDALTRQTKDLQIAAWLLESLTMTRGFDGVIQGLSIINRLLTEFWDTVYPEIEDDDLDYRAGPLEFINDKLWVAIKQIPVTDPGITQGFSWIDWQESRQVGYEADTLNEYGDVIDDKKKARDEKIAEGKLSAEEFDRAAAASSRACYETLMDQTAQCLALFAEFDNIVDEKFGREAPRLAELKSSIEDCHNFVQKTVKEKRKAEPEPEPEPEPEHLAEPAGRAGADDSTDAPTVQVRAPEGTGSQVQTSLPPGGRYRPGAGAPPEAAAGFHVNRLLGSGGLEEVLWQDALEKLSKEGIKQALEQLLGAACSAQSIRERTNFKLLTAKLCLRAGRPDLARPIVEELNTLIEDLQLERWESPIWIAGALGILYQCLTAEGSSDDDQYRARDILTRMCTLDVTKAMEYSNRTKG